jgi:hypothetical protein
MSLEAITAVAQYQWYKWINRLRCATSHEEYATLQRDQLHAFRMELEPYIYHYLIEQYGLRLNAVWDTYTPPLKSDKAYVLVERRAHPNYPFVLKMMAWAAPHLSVYLVCSNENLEFIKAILGDKIEHFHIIIAYSGEVDRDQGRTEYNQLLTEASFFEMIDAEYIVTMQMDVFLRRKLTDDLFCGDYWGPPWGWCPHRAGGGGATIRRVQKMIEICKADREDPLAPCKEGEDSWMSDRVQDFPPLKFRRAHIMESMPAEDPIIVHQFWTYLNNYDVQDREQFTENLKRILTIHL